ncbi:MAG TPA: porphobilinogen synthase [Spirochaetota bacterium]|nr:porphobilinogen synthase [Spirochaetota bacterium]HNU93078.1 porphobilinogen synthase [Spirochaetota bacterium]HPV99298.1 porphobilinogen synthase [Spirochaetota bacterium]
MYTDIRPRRLRASAAIRNLAAETSVDKRRLIMPHFVSETAAGREPIASMPGIDRVSIDELLRDVESDLKLGISYVLLFGIPAVKDDSASSAYDDNGIVQKAVRALKERMPEACVITDVCLCEYMAHGHCGIVKDGRVLNDPTLELLADTALSHAAAGADMVAPSDMMDGRVAAIRDALDENGFLDMPILSYAAKYASAFYGPFRDAAGSAPRFGDRRSYQMDYRNALEAEKEVLLDIDEGADIVMVKPALSYLDIIRRVREIVNVPVCAYNVSGEYSMVKAAAKLGYADERMLATEILTSIFRAGADMVISYHTREVFREGWL